MMFAADNEVACLLTHAAMLKNASSRCRAHGNNDGPSLLFMRESTFILLLPPKKLYPSERRLQKKTSRRAVIESDYSFFRP